MKSNCGPTSTKRKAEEELERIPDKAFKVERTGTIKPTESYAKPLTSIRQNASTRAPPAAPQSVQASAKNPKKGSFAAIMARAKDVQAQPINSTGSITHKPKDKVKTKTRKEMVMEREAAKKAAKKGIPFTGLTSNRDSAGKDSLKKPVERANSTPKKSGEKGATKASEKSGYQGTMQPSNTSRYTGTARPQTSNTKTVPNARDLDARRSNQMARQKRDYDEPDDDESDDGYDCASEDFSDMDAGFDVMEEEEEQATKEARKEDAAEQAELDRLKREKGRKKILLAKGKR